MDLSELHADAEPYTISSKSGMSLTVYRVPFPSEGPELLQLRAGGRVLVYMYAHFVFRWIEGTSKVQISHGDIHGNQMQLPFAINIEQRWDRVILAERGRQWVHQHLAKFRK